MNARTASIASVLPLIALPIAFHSPAPARAELAFAPREGLTLARTFEFVGEFETQSDSEQHSATGSYASERGLSVIDRVLAVDGDRVIQLERVFDEMNAETEGRNDFGGESHDFGTWGTSELEGATVLFEWDADDEEYLASSDEVDGDVLDALLYDYDFLSLLPEDTVSEGDAWSVDGETFAVLLDPWQGFPWDWETSSGESHTSRPGDGDEPDESTDGEVTATLVGTRDEDGVPVAVIELEGEIETETAHERTREHEHGSSTTYSENTDARSIEGEALWDLDGGHLHSLELEIELEGVGTSHNTFVFGDREFEHESDNERYGTSTLSVSFERLAAGGE